MTAKDFILNEEPNANFETTGGLSDAGFWNRIADIAERYHLARSSEISVTVNEITLKNIILLVSTEFGISVSELVSRNQYRRLVEPRYVYMVMAIKYRPSLTRNEIAAPLGKNHDSTYHAQKTLPNLMEQDPILKKRYDIINKKLSLIA